MASSTSFKNLACSRTPGVPKVLGGAPTATTSLSYGRVNSGFAAVISDSSLHRTVRATGSTAIAAASKKEASPGFPGRSARTGSMSERASTVPTVTPGRSGVLRKKLRGDTTETSYRVGSMFLRSATAPQPLPRTTSLSRGDAFDDSCSARGNGAETKG